MKYDMIILVSETYFLRKSAPGTATTFLALRARLVAVVEIRIRNGQTTERGFARQVGVSQPHIHNVLKGMRSLSPELSDRILAKLGLTILDLLEDGEPLRPLPGKSRAPLPRSAAN